MKKTYQMFFALMLLALGAINVNAAERIPLTVDEFYSYDGFGVDANRTGKFSAAYLIDTADGCPFGDTSCNAWVDLANYSKLYIKMAGCDADGNLNGSNPRIFINRLETEGQFNGDKAQSKCLVIPNAGTWAEEFYTVEDDGTYVINLTKIKKEWGFAHFHSIKGSAWNTKAIVYSIEVEEASKSQQVGWLSKISNGDLEGDNVKNFQLAENATVDAGYHDAVIYDEAGKDGSRGIRVSSIDGASETWATQFFVVANEPLMAGAKWRLSFDARADRAAHIGTGCHHNPREWKAGGGDAGFGEFDITADWNTYTFEGTVPDADWAKNEGLLSLAMDLNTDKETANTFYFDNIVFEEYKVGITAEYDLDVIQLDFGFQTNIPELVKAGGAKRLLFPKSCVTVKAGGKTLTEDDIMSVEGYEDGRFYIFFEDMLDDSKEIEVSFTNPSDEAYRLKYLAGPGGDVPNFDGVAENNSDIMQDDVYAYIMETPTLMSSDPEEGSFNLPNNIKEFKLVFDKEVDSKAIEATLGKEKLTVATTEAFAKEITLQRSGSGDLASGSYTLKITKIYPELRLADEVFGDAVVTFSVGKVVVDPTDVPKDILPLSYCNDTNEGEIPAGFKLTCDDGAEVRMAPTSYGSGPRTFAFASGGDFTKGLYTRNGYIEYGTIEGYELPLVEGKKYAISFNTARWKAAGQWFTFEVINPSGEIEFSKLIENNPDVNGSKDAVKNSTAFAENFIAGSTGNYTLKWTVCTSTGELVYSGYTETLLANVQVRYLPNVAGVEETQLLETALSNAKAVRDVNDDTRFGGATLEALKAAITKCESEMETYTAPSQYKEAAAALDAAAKAMNDHHTLCATYDPLPERALAIVENNADNKFGKTAIYETLKGVAAKYATRKDEFTVEVKELKDDAELEAAIAELQSAINKTSKLFTEGASSANTTGVAALTERLRIGAETLKTLGLAESDEVFAEISNALGDDDALANKVKNLTKAQLYGQLKNADNKLFEATVDENTLEETTPTYNLTVFVKNPNLYVTRSDSKDISEEAVPGWTIEREAGYDVSWNSQWGDAWKDSWTGWEDNASNDYAVDATLTNWACGYTATQTIEDLPAGVYTIKAGLMERDGSDGILDNSITYLFANTSSTPEGEYGQSALVSTIGQQDFNLKDNTVLENVEVTDGLLTVGINTNGGSHLFFNYLQIFLAGPAAGFDYGKAYEDVITGIDDSAAQQAKVVRLELFDLNGKRIPVAKKGMYIVKKYLSNGQVVTEKIIK